MALEFLAIIPPEWRVWINAVLIFAGVYIILLVLRKVLVFQLRVISTRTSNKIDDSLLAAIEGIGWQFYLFFALMVMSNLVGLTGFIARVIELSALAISLFYIVHVVQVVLLALIDRYIQKTNQNKHDPTILYFASKFATYALWLVAALILVENAGYDINALIAGLGVAGIAIALGLQNILSDIFSSLSIYFDKPFKVGDFIIVGADMGVVTKVGIKTTRILALQGEEIVISNRELTESRIHNFGMMSQRRVEFKFGVTYETPAAKLNKVNELVAQSVAKVAGARLDRVHFKKFGDYSLDFEAVYYVPTGDYNKYMDAQQAINFSLVGLFAKEGIEFAYPVQRIFLDKGGVSLAKKSGARK